MKKLFVLILFLIPSSVINADQILEKCKQQSVMVYTHSGSGSGVIFKNGEKSFVWTAAHVVKGCQSVKTVIDPDNGLPKVEIKYLDCYVIKPVFANSRKVGEISMLAKVIRFSPAHDLCLLSVYLPNYGDSSITIQDKVSEAGDKIWHVGSMAGDRGINSVSEGVFSVAGRLRKDFINTDTDNPHIYDQVAITFHPGSSGGGVFSHKTGDLLGLVTEFLGPDRSYGTGCIVPVRRMKIFCKDSKCEWALNKEKLVPEDYLKVVTVDSVKMPDDWPK